MKIKSILLGMGVGIFSLCFSGVMIAQAEKDTQTRQTSNTVVLYDKTPAKSAETNIYKNGAPVKSSSPNPAYNTGIQTK